MCLPAWWDAPTEHCPLSPAFLPGPATKGTSIPVSQQSTGQFCPSGVHMGNFQARKSDLKTAYDDSTSLELLPCCPGACPLVPRPATGNLHSSRGQHCYSDKTELRELPLRAVLGTHILCRLCKYLCWYSLYACTFRLSLYIASGYLIIIAQSFMFVCLRPCISRWLA